MKASVQILTMGARPTELERAVSSATAQRNADVEVVVVSNGAAIPEPPGARLITLPTNEGVCGGRNAGIEAANGDVLLFIDDDASYPDPTAAFRVLELFEANQRLGIVSFRVEDPTGAPGQRRHVPRLRAADPMRAGEVTTFLGGACAIRKTVFDRCGLLPAEFFFGHEETDLAWRALDAGFTIHYEPSIVVHHPAEPPSRHATHYFMTARNRVFVARRRLPVVLAIIYLKVWFVLSLSRAPDMAARKATLKGFREGARLPCGPRKPMRWRTVWRMARLGRPPII